MASINEHCYKAPEDFSCSEGITRASDSTDPSTVIGEGSQDTSHCCGCEGPSTYGDIIIIIIKIIIVAARSKACVCSRSLTRIAGSNPAGAWMSVSCECCALSGRGLCSGLTTRPEESKRVWCV